MPVVLYSLFFILPSFTFLSFFLHFPSWCLLILLRFSPRGFYYSALWLSPLLCMARPLFIVPLWQDFTILAFNNLYLAWVSLPMTYWFISHSTTTTYLCWPWHQTKKAILFVYLLCYSVSALSLPILHGMHLVVPAHPCFLWVVCHPSRIFPLKEFEQEPQNRFSPLPTARPCLLTSDP